MFEPLRETVVYGLTQENQVLLGKRLDSTSFYFDQYVLPAGKVELSDRLSRDYLVEAMLRETREELGIIPTNYRYLFSRSYRVNPTLLHFFAVTQWQGEITNLEPTKEQFDWFDIDDVLDTTPIQSLRDGLTAISAFLQSESAARQQLLEP